jgi:hypothetical protein
MMWNTMHRDIRPRSIRQLSVQVDRSYRAREAVTDASTRPSGSPNLPDPTHDVPNHTAATGFLQAPVSRNDTAAVRGCESQVHAVVDGHTVPDGQVERRLGPVPSRVELDRKPREGTAELCCGTLVELSSPMLLPQHITQLGPEEVRSQKLVL